MRVEQLKLAHSFQTQFSRGVMLSKNHVIASHTPKALSIMPGEGSGPIDGCTFPNPTLLSGLPNFIIAMNPIKTMRNPITMGTHVYELG